jgi:hypothetical protein
MKRKIRKTLNFRNSLPVVCEDCTAALLLPAPPLPAAEGSIIVAVEFNIVVVLMNTEHYDHSQLMYTSAKRRFSAVVMTSDGGQACCAHDLRPAHRRVAIVLLKLMDV